MKCENRKNKIETLMFIIKFKNGFGKSINLLFIAADVINAIERLVYNSTVFTVIPCDVITYIVLRNEVIKNFILVKF